MLFQQERWNLAFGHWLLFIYFIVAWSFWFQLFRSYDSGFWPNLIFNRSTALMLNCAYCVEWFATVITYRTVVTSWPLLLAIINRKKNFQCHGDYSWLQTIMRFIQPQLSTKRNYQNIQCKRVCKLDAQIFCVIKRRKISHMLIRVYQDLYNIIQLFFISFKRFCIRFVQKVAFVFSVVWLCRVCDIVNQKFNF